MALNPNTGGAQKTEYSASTSSRRISPGWTAVFITMVSTSWSVVVLTVDQFSSSRLWQQRVARLRL